jgi:hypothetical protein
MNPNTKFDVPAHVMARTVGKETVILDLESGTYFGLDPVGARIWQLIGAGHSVSSICEVMVEEYEVSREALEHDVLALAQELVTRKLIDVT